MSLGWPACAADGDEALPVAYRRVAVPEALTTAEARRRGQTAFQEYCSVCHGADGHGQGSRREGLMPPPRNFKDPAWRASVSPRRIFFVIREGLAPSAMPGWKALSEQQAWDLTAYVLSIGGDPR